jgi:hypothetical protein
MTFMEGLIVGMLIGLCLRELVLPLLSHVIVRHRHARVVHAMGAHHRRPHDRRDR